MCEVRLGAEWGRCGLPGLSGSLGGCVSVPDQVGEFKVVWIKLISCRFYIFCLLQQNRTLYQQLLCART